MGRDDVDVEAHKSRETENGLFFLRDALESARDLTAQPQRRQELAALLDDIETAIDDAIVHLPGKAPRR